MKDLVVSIAGIAWFIVQWISAYHSLHYHYYYYYYYCILHQLREKTKIYSFIVYCLYPIGHHSELRTSGEYFQQLCFIGYNSYACSKGQ